MFELCCNFLTCSPCPTVNPWAAEVAEAVRLSDAPESPYYGGQGGGSGPAGSSLNFFVPPPIAIAHHLLRQWAQHEGPWFTPEGQEQQQHGGQQQQRAAAASEPIPVSSL